MAHSPQQTDLGPGATRVTGAVVVLVTALVVGLFLREFPELLGPVAVGGVGWLLLAATLWLSTGGERSVTGLAAGLLVVLAGVTLAGGVVVAILLVVDDLFPVEDQALLSVGWLVTLGHVGVVVGCSLAVFGVVLSRRNVATGESLVAGVRLTAAATVVPLGTALLLVLVGVQSSGSADGALVAPLAGPVQLLVSPAAVVLPEPLLLVALLAALATLLAVGVGRLQARLAASESAPEPRTVGAVAGGTVATVGVVATSQWAYRRVVSELLRRFPAEIEGELRDVSTNTATSLGESTAVLVAAVFAVGVALGLLVVFYVVVGAGYLSGESTGSSLAAVGLFIAAVFAGTISAPSWLVVLGVAASLLVWDAGRFGVALSREVGAGRTRRVELVHLVGALTVGLAAAVVALAFVGRLSTGSDAAVTGRDLLALASVVVGLLSLVFALR